MKLSEVLLVGVISSCTVYVSSTFLTTAVGTGFLGGFVMGKITLGMFLAAMNSLNQSPTSGPATLNKVATRDQSGLLNIPDSVEIEVRDRFLRQLGKMDPLNCLPKVFCEVSADPKAASQVLGSEAMKVLTKTSLFNPNGLQTKRTTKPNRFSNDQGDDIRNDDDNSSQSDEDDNEEEDKVEEYHRKEQAALKAKGMDELDEWMDYDDDPVNYYFLLKEKKKPIHPELMAMIKDVDFSSRRSFVKKPSVVDMFRKRIDTLSSQEPRKNDASTGFQSKTESEKSKDVFADDPFFEEFSRSVRRPQVGGGSGGVINVGLLRRNRRDTFADRTEDDVTMAKYKIAAEVAEMKDSQKCRRIFNTCPFTAEEVMTMITKLNSDDANKTLSSSSNPWMKELNKKNKQDNGLTNLKNTLFAIEKLNDATLIAEASGGPVNYTQVVQDATKSNSKVSDGSSQILEQLDQIEEKFIVPESTEVQQVQVVEEISKRKFKKPKNKKQKQSLRIRRHDDGSRIRILSIETFNNRNKNLNPRISVSRQNGKLVLSGGLDDEFLVDSGKHPALRGHKYSEEDSDEDISEDVKLPNVYMGKIKKSQAKPQRVTNPSFNKKVEVLHSEEEDDEFNSPESEEVVNSSVPTMTFSQAFIDTLGGPTNIRKSKPKPVHKVVQVKPQALRATTTTKPPSPSTTPPKKPAKVLPKLKPQFSGESEDDEEDAINSEKKIDALVSKYKPRDKRH